MVMDVVFMISLVMVVGRIPVT